MKRFSFVLVMISLILFIKAAPVKYVSSTPNSGSDISEFYVTLTFDIEEAIAEAGDGEWGIGYSGASTTSARNKNRAILYEGEPNSGTELARSLTSSLTGASDNFIVGGNTITMTFPQSIKPEVGKKYYIEVGNIFAIYKKGSSTWLDNSKLSFNTDPLILTFTGAGASSEELVWQSSSITDNSDIEILQNVSFTFNEPIAICKDGKIEIIEDDEVKYTATNLKILEDKLSVEGNFSIPIALLNGHQYKIRLAENSVCLSSNETVKNKAVIMSVNGLAVSNIPVINTNPANNSVGIYDKLTITFDIPASYTLTPPYGRAHNRKGLIYENSVEQTNLIKEFSGVVGSDGKSQEFDLSFISPKPSTKYVFVKPANEITLWKEDMSYPEYGNEEYIISWTTPSIEDLGISPINVGQIKVGRHDSSSSPEFVDGGTYANINTIELKKEDYIYNGETINTTLDWDNLKTYVYDVTDDTRILVKEMEIGAAQRETNYDYYGVFVIAPMMDFLQNHTYEIVIPKGVIRLSNNTLYNYATNDEIVLTVKGATPAEFSVESCSVENNAEMSALPPAIVWTINGAYTLKSNDLFAIAKLSTSEVGYSQSQCPITIFNNGWKTYVTAHLANTMTGELPNLKEGYNFTITIPTGSIVYPTDETLCNPELSVAIKGIDTPIEVPEFVNTTVTLADNETNEAHSFIVKSAKGYPAEIQMLPGENWNVANVVHEGKSLTAVNGVYTSEPLTADSKIVATFAFNKDMQFDQTTGVYSVTDTNIKVYTENDQIVVSGLTQSTNIAVYSVGGILVKQMTTEAAYDMVRISAEPNEIYVVVINGQAAKVRL